MFVRYVCKGVGHRAIQGTWDTSKTPAQESEPTEEDRVGEPEGESTRREEEVQDVGVERGDGTEVLGEGGNGDEEAEDEAGEDEDTEGEEEDEGDEDEDEEGEGDEDDEENDEQGKGNDDDDDDEGNLGPEDGEDGIEDEDNDGEGFAVL